jgi:hypothetical protein
MVAKGGTSSSAGREDLALAEERAGDAMAYVELVKKLGLGSTSHIKPNSRIQMLDVLAEACLIRTRRALKDASLDEADPLDGVRAKMLKGAKLLPKLEEAMRTVDAARLESQRRLHTEDQHSERWYPVDESPVALQASSLTARKISEAAPYADRVVGIVNEMLTAASAGAAADNPHFALDAKREFALLDKTTLILTGEELADISVSSISPYQRFAALDETCEEQLLLLREAYHADHRVTAEERETWDALVLRMIRLQRLAASDPAKLMVYVFRDQAQKHKGDVLAVQWFHVAWFDTMNDPARRFCAFGGPPGHGKSSDCRAEDAWLIGTHDPERGAPRLLILTDTVPKSEKEIDVMSRVLKSGWYRAVFPNIRILDRSDNAREGIKGFTVGSVGHAFDREPTVEGCSVFSNPHGNRYDRIRGDDFFPPEVRYQDQTRDRAQRNYDGVIQTRLDDGGRIALTCIPWHPDDAVGRLRKQAREDPNCTWLVRFDEFAIQRDEKNLPIPLWPERIGRTDLIRMSKSDTFTCTHELAPEKGQRRGLQAVRYYPSDPNDPLIAYLSPDRKARLLLELKQIARGERWLSIDPASADTKIACDIGAGKWALTETGKLYHTQMHWFRGQPGDLEKWVLRQIVGDELYDSRWVNPDDTHEDKLKKLDRARTIRPAVGDVDQVAMESGGPQTAQYKGLRDHIADGLQSMGITWNGTVHACLPQDGSHTNVSKTIRFNSVANFFRDGTVLFPGRLETTNAPSAENKDGITTGPLESGANDDVAKLVRQFLRFPNGAKDGVDQGVQLVVKLHDENRLGVRGATPEQAAEQQGLDPMTAALRATLRQLREQGQETQYSQQMREEDSWTQEVLVA